ncbi:hypothetical protein POTOM_020707 [Populus tomentosa]|uniref:Uncharacterized protein n=1 Tax=Populus tomentosa TaxID=118781 RepID=A0A8X7ZP62_POPTO|nr:hypothetical protein POTOM_020707 [Populus tomentosa]
MCCGKRVCVFCTCVVLVAILIGLLFGFGIYKNGFHKLKDAFHECDSSVSGSLCGAGIGRPFMGACWDWLIGISFGSFVKLKQMPCSLSDPAMGLKIMTFHTAVLICVHFDTHLSYKTSSKWTSQDERNCPFCILVSFT